MKHPANREFFAYWNEKRGEDIAPDRSVMAPDAVRHLLGDIFVLGYDLARGYPVRVAGTRMCALLGNDLKGHSFTGLFAGDSRRDIEDILVIVAEESLATVAGVTASMAGGAPAHLELLLLPFNNRAHTPLSMTGLLAPMTPVHGVLGDFHLTSWRHIEPEPRPRILRKWEMARGFMVYEGLR